MKDEKVKYFYFSYRANNSASDTDRFLVASHVFCKIKRSINL